MGLSSPRAKEERSFAAELLCFAAVHKEGKTSGKKLLHYWEGYRSWGSILLRCC